MAETNVYYGTKTESSEPLTTGLMWFTDGKVDHIRHTARQEDRLKRWGWIEHDGDSYGKEKLIDDKHSVKLEISHIKNDVAIVNVTTKSKKKIEQNCSIIFYVWDESDTGAMSVHHSSDGETTIISGNHAEHGDYKYKIYRLGAVADAISTPVRTHHEGRRIESPDDLWKVKEAWVEPTLKRSYMQQQGALNKRKNQRKKKKSKKMKKYPNVIPKLSDRSGKGGKANIIAVQKVLSTPFILAIETKYGDAENEEESDESQKILSKFEAHSRKFSDTFQRVFNFNNEYTDNKKYTNFAKAAFSNLIGSITHFHGSSLVKHPEKGKEPTLSKSGPLITGVPSRSFFPRGFLWDEGFHQLLVVEWDPRLTMKVLKHWFHRMDEKGWIPREQILGAEALSKVPKQFQVQSPDVANPPALLLSIERLVEIADQSLSQEISSNGFAENVDNDLHNTVYDFLNDVRPYLIRWYKWLKTTQSGPSYGTFRWRGRTKTHTLSSGLDDYPRGLYPSENDKHADLLSWMAYSARTLKRLFTLLQTRQEASGSDSTMLAETKKYIQLYTSDEKVFTDALQQHWDDETKLFHDISINGLVHDEKTGRPIGFKEPELVRHFGYVSIFPLALRLLKPDDERLGHLIHNLRDETRGLWSPYGIRSLSKHDKLFGKEENYWRGKIWININFLTLKALYKYSSIAGPYQEKAKMVYGELRKNVINNIYEQYRKGGFIYENYNSENGRGAGCHPFTGWSSLVVLIMGERY